MKLNRQACSAAVVVVSVLAAGCFDHPDSAPPTAAVDQPPAEQPPAEQPPAAERLAEPGDRFSPHVSADGAISLPASYKRWAHLGGWAVAQRPGETIHEMHSVYTQPATIAAFNKTGEFPDGAVLVKEVRQAKANTLTTGHAAWSTDIKIWFVMIKDRQQRFANNDHWGDGWGWALFEAKDPTKNVSAGYDTSCLACHTPVKDTDWIYTYGYPDLKPPPK